MGTEKLGYTNLNSALTAVPLDITVVLLMNRRILLAHGALAVPSFLTTACLYGVLDGVYGRGMVEGLFVAGIRKCHPMTVGEHSKPGYGGFLIAGSQ